MRPSQEALRVRIAQALAQKFTIPQKYIPSTERPGRYQSAPASLAERTERVPQVLPPRGGSLGIVRPTCLEIADVVAAAVEAELEQRLAAVHAELDCWQATLDTGVMAGTDWERCLATNLPILRAALETPQRHPDDEETEQ